MTSITDLDQGGTYRPYFRTYLGPSIGWTPIAAATFPVTIAGTYQVQPGVTLVTVNAAGPVFIILRSAIPPQVPATVQPMLFELIPLTIVDIGGNAGANPIVIEPFSPAENIMGLTSISISVNYGAYTLTPNPALSGWSSISP